VYINAVDSWLFFGFNNNVEMLISSSGTELINPININTVRALSVVIDGDISFNHKNMEPNLKKSVCKASDLIFQTSVNVSQVYFQNTDGGDSSKYSIGNNDRIKHFISSVYDQDGNTMTDMTDNIIQIQFTTIKKVKKKYY
jgi:hypothetical protein